MTRPADPETIGEALRILRQRANLSREQVAEIAGVSARTLSRYERGDTTLDVFILRTLARVYASTLDIERDELWLQLTDLIDRRVLATQITDEAAAILGGHAPRRRSTD